MQTKVDMYGNRITILPSGSGNCRVNHGDHGHVQFCGDAQKQSQMVVVHVAGYSDDQTVAAMRDRCPDLLQLPAGQIRGTQVLETPIDKWRGLQIRPKRVLYSPRLNPGIRDRIIAGRQFIIVQQRESGLAVKNAFTIENRDPGVVQVYGEQTHCASPLVRLHMAD